MKKIADTCTSFFCNARLWSYYSTSCQEAPQTYPHTNVLWKQTQLSQIFPPEGWVIIRPNSPKVRTKISIDSSSSSFFSSSDPSYTTNSLSKQKTHPSPLLEKQTKKQHLWEKQVNKTKNALPLLKNIQKTPQSENRRRKELFFSFARTTYCVQLRSMSNWK